MENIDSWQDLQAWWYLASEGEKVAVLAGIFLFGAVTALVANGKGRNPLGWFIFGAVLPLIGLIVALAVPNLRPRLAAAIAPTHTVYVQQPAPPPPREGSITEEIQEAKALLDEGTITKAEFDTIKAKILRR